MKFGLKSSDFELLHQLAIEPLKKHGAIVWIFGSRARGNNKPYSDIDLLYHLRDGSLLPPGVLYEIKSSLEESRLAYKVDLVNDSDLAESYRKQVTEDQIEL